MAEMTGGQHTTSTSAKQLEDDDTPCTQIFVRNNTGNGVLYHGGSDITSAPTNAHGFMKAEEAYTFSLSRGYIRARDIYIVSTASAETVFWDGIPS